MVFLFSSGHVSQSHLRACSVSLRSGPLGEAGSVSRARHVGRVAEAQQEVAAAVNQEPHKDKGDDGNVIQHAHDMDEAALAIRIEPMEG